MILYSAYWGFMIKDKVSIIGNALNEGSYVKETLDHIVKETEYPNYEIILVDDGSTDQSFDQINPAKYSIPVKIIRNEQSIGFSKTRNLGAKQATGEYLVFIDCHIFPTKNWLQEMVKAVNYEDGGMSVVRVMDLKSQPFPEGISHTYTFSDYYLNISWYLENNKEIFEVPFADGCSHLIRREIFDKIHGYTEEFVRVGREDTEICLKNCLLGYKIYTSPKATVRHYFKETWGAGFNVYGPLMYNTLLFGYLHFSENNFLKLVNTAKNYAYVSQAVYDILKNDQLKEVRSYYKSIFKYDDIWFFNKFSKYFEVMNAHYRSLYKERIDPIIKHLISHLFSEDPKNQMFDTDSVILDFKKETALTNKDIQILIQDKINLIDISGIKHEAL